jgi:predicted alpha/beta-fold hydrolase
LLVVPGVTGSASEPYVQEICTRANKRGYNAIVINCLASKDGDIGQRVLDMSDVAILR